MNCLIACLSQSHFISTRKSTEQISTLPELKITLVVRYSSRLANFLSVIVGFCIENLKEIANLSNEYLYIIFKLDLNNFVRILGSILTYLRFSNEDGIHLYKRGLIFFMVFGKTTDNALHIALNK